MRQQPTIEPTIRLPQARILHALAPPPDYGECDPMHWPIMTRQALARLSGYSEISGSVTRSLNGVPEGSSSGPAQAGLIELRYVEVVTVDIDGVNEENYRITPSGLAALRAWRSAGRTLPPIKEAASCTNRRYSPQ